MNAAAAQAGLEPVLLIKGKGGFGNRILAASTGIVLAELTGRRPVIDWRDGIFLPEGVNLYPLLFDAPDTCDPETFDDAREVIPSIWAGRLAERTGALIDSECGGRHASPFVYRKLSIDLARPDHPAPVAVFFSYLPKLARLRGRMARHPLYRGRSSDDVLRSVLARHFTPNARVRHAVDALFAGRERPVIGVHIRHTDLAVPLAPFEAALGRLRRDMPESEIFLATDSAAVQDRFTRLFDRTFVIDKALSDGPGGLHRPDHRDSEAAFSDPLREAENALIDLWALSQCDWLVHASRSTFSVLAALLGSIPRSRQVDIDRFNPKIRSKQWFQARS